MGGEVKFPDCSDEKNAFQKRDGTADSSRKGTLCSVCGVPYRVLREHYAARRCQRANDEERVAYPALQHRAR